MESDQIHGADSHPQMIQTLKHVFSIHQHKQVNLCPFETTQQHFPVAVVKRNQHNGFHQLHYNHLS